MKTPVVRTGLTRLLAGERPELRVARLGLIAHQASVTPELTAATDALRGAGLKLVSLFGPQHGVQGEKQDDMIESVSFTDTRLGIPVHSLYGEVRKPTAEM